jgi:hypothetical protein
VFVGSGKEREELVKLYRSGTTHRLRERAQAILLSERGYRVEALADLFEVNRDTVSFWLERWISRGSEETMEAALSDAFKCGRPCKLPPLAREELQALAAVGVPNLKAEGMELVKKRAFSLLGHSKEGASTGPILVSQSTSCPRQKARCAQTSGSGKSVGKVACPSSQRAVRLGFWR